MSKSNAVICIDTPGTAETADQAGFEAAVAAARELADRCGPNWVGTVWENCGWRYKAQDPSRRLCVYVYIYGGKEPSYSVDIHEADRCGAPLAFGRMPSAKTPKAAITAGLRVARESIAELASYVEGL